MGTTPLDEVPSRAALIVDARTLCLTFAGVERPQNQMVLCPLHTLGTFLPPFIFNGRLRNPFEIKGFRAPRDDL